jgi:cystathionine beta-lyase/cystathionine gamma-synthase
MKASIHKYSIPLYRNFSSKSHHSPQSIDYAAETLLVNKVSVSATDQKKSVHCSSNPSSYPIYQTATFYGNRTGEDNVYDYTRSGNPTRDHLQSQLALIEAGNIQLSENYYSFAYSSGMSAISCCAQIVQYLDKSANKHENYDILSSYDLYGGTTRLLNKLLPGSNVLYCDFTDHLAIETLLKSSANLKLVIFESPTNPNMSIIDIKAVAQLIKKYYPQCLVVFDNTICTGLFQKPLDYPGVDIVIYSGTKYLSGHADSLSGVAITKSKLLAEQLQFIQNATGTALAPFDSWLLQRGLKTLFIRMKEQERVATKVAHWLQQSPYIDALNYPGLKSHKNYDIQQKQSSNNSGLLSLSLKAAAAQKGITKLFVNNLQLFHPSVSFGSCSSTVTIPAYSSHKAVQLILSNHHNHPIQHHAKLLIDPNLIRLSIGLESEFDLINDIEQALHKAHSSTAH